MAAAASTGARAEDGLSVAWGLDGSVLHAQSRGRGGATTALDTLHLRLTVDSQTWSEPGWTGFADLMAVDGGRAATLVGDAQGVSNLDGPHGNVIEEFWVQHNTPGNRASLLFGWYDINTEFDRVQAAGLLQNGAFGVGTEFGQSGVEGPSTFPRTALALRLGYKPSPATVVRTVVADGVPFARPDGSHEAFRSGDGVLAVGEFAWLGRPAPSQPTSSDRRDLIGRLSGLQPYDDKFAVGAWHYTARFPVLGVAAPGEAAPTQRGSSGAYLVAEHLLMRGADDHRRLSAFVQWGAADARTNRFASHIGLGLVGSGWLGAGAPAQFGVGVTQAVDGAAHRRDAAARGEATTRAETTVELTYLRQMSRVLSLQPDVQWIHDPDADATRATIWVAQLRFEIAF